MQALFSVCGKGGSMIKVVDLHRDQAWSCDRNCSNRHERQPVNILKISSIAGDQLGVGKQRRRGDATVKGFQTGVCPAQVACDPGNLGREGQDVYRFQEGFQADFFLCRQRRMAEEFQLGQGGDIHGMVRGEERLQGSDSCRFVIGVVDNGIGIEDIHRA